MARALQIKTRGASSGLATPPHATWRLGGGCGGDGASLDGGAQAFHSSNIRVDPALEPLGALGDLGVCGAAPPSRLALTAV